MPVGDDGVEAAQRQGLVAGPVGRGNRLHQLGFGQSQPAFPQLEEQITVTSRIAVDAERLFGETFRGAACRRARVDLQHPDKHAGGERRRVAHGHFVALVGLGWVEATHPEDRDGVREAVRAGRLDAARVAEAAARVQALRRRVG